MVKFTSGGPKNKGIKFTSGGPKNNQDEETLGQQTKRTSIATGIKGVENTQNLLGLAKSGLVGLGSLFGVEEPHARLEREGKLSPEQARIPDVSQLLQEKSGYTPQELQPRNTVENFIQRFGSQAPITSLLGGIPALGSTAIGSGVASGAGALGAPEGLQDIFQLATELGYGVHKGRIPTVEGQQQKAYAKAEKYLTPSLSKPPLTSTGSSIPLKLVRNKVESNIAPIQNALNEASKKLGKETTKKVAEEITHALGTVEKNLNQVTGKLKVKDALDLRRKLAETYDTVSKNAKPYIKDVRDSVNTFFAQYGAYNPKFLDKLNHADKLTTFKHMETVVDKFANYLLEKYPGGVGTSGKATIKLLGIPFGFLEKHSKSLFTNSAARKYYLDLTKAASTQNTPLFINTLKKIDANLE